MIPVKRVIKIIFVEKLDRQRLTSFCLASSFQIVCELVDLTLTMHLTILFCFLISREYVNLLI